MFCGLPEKEVIFLNVFLIDGWDLSTGLLVMEVDVEAMVECCWSCGCCVVLQVDELGAKNILSLLSVSESSFSLVFLWHIAMVVASDDVNESVSELEI